MLDTQQAISVYIYEEACCLFMHTDTEHILVESCGEVVSRDTGHWACLGQRTGCTNTLLLCASCFIHLASFTFPSFSALHLSIISLASHPPHLPSRSHLCPSLLSSFPSSPLLLSPSPFSQTICFCWGGLLSSPKGRALTLLYGPLRHPCPSFLASAAAPSPLLTKGLETQQNNRCAIYRMCVYD